MGCGLVKTSCRPPADTEPKQNSKNPLSRGIRRYLENAMPFYVEQVCADERDNENLRTEIMVQCIRHQMNEREREQHKRRRYDQSEGDIPPRITLGDLSGANDVLLP